MLINFEKNLYVQTIQLLIVENDLLIAEDVSQKLSRLGYKVTAKVTNAEDALLSIENNRPDIILMDIDLDGDTDGIELAGQINSHRSIPIIYLTELNDPRTLNRIQNTHLSVFMNKPFNEHILAYNIELAIKGIEKNSDEVHDLKLLDDALFLKENGNTGKRVKVSFDDICYIKASRSYSEIYVRNDKGNRSDSSKLIKFEPAVSMAEVFKQLSTPPFLQVHRSYVINVKHVEAFQEDDLLIYGVPIPLGPSFKAEVKSRLKMV